MNEQDLREALREAMADAVPPKPVTADAALTRAQRARRMRRANLAGLGVGVAVVALVAGAFTLNVPRTLLNLASQPSASAPATSSTEGGDRTQHNGPQNDKSVQLQDMLDSVLPAGIAPATEAQMSGAAFGLRTHQAQVEDRSTQAWSYEAIEPVAHPGQTGVGRLIVEVYDSRNNIPRDPCQMAQYFWGVGGNCHSVQVGGKTVQVISHTNDERIGSVAAYRYPDGTMVYLAQSTDYFGSHVPALPAQPLTDDQLANLVLTPGFKVA